MKLNELLEATDFLDAMIIKVIQRYRFDIPLKQARELVLMDYEDGGIEKVTPADIVEIFDASGIPSLDDDDDDDE